MARALLINPWIYDFKSYDFWIKPFGLLKIAGLLKPHVSGIDFIDCIDRYDNDYIIAHGSSKYKPDEIMYGKGKYCHEPIPKPGPYKSIKRNYKRFGIPESVFREKLKKLPVPGLVLITTPITYMYPAVIDALRIVKEIHGSMPVIIGGIYPTLCFEHAKKTFPGDYIWKGDINNDFIRLVNNITGAAIPEMSAEQVNELVPDYSIYPYLKSVAVKFTKGCPFNCTYCSVKQFAAGYYKRKPENVLSELETYHKRGIKNIAFYDDALLFDRQYITTILKHVISAEYGFYFHTLNGLNARYIDSETAELMYNAGFVDVRVSLETTDPVLQKQTGGKIDTATFDWAIDNLKKAGYKNSDIGVYTLVGLPGQSAESVHEDISHVKSLGLKVKMSLYSPIPGTSEFDRLNPGLKEQLVSEPLLHNEDVVIYDNKLYSPESHKLSKLFSKSY